MLAQRDPGVDLERLALAANPRLRQPDIECSVLIEMSNLTLADPQRRAGTARPLPKRRSIDEIEARRQELNLPITQDAILQDEQSTRRIAVRTALPLYASS